MIVSVVQELVSVIPSLASGRDVCAEGFRGIHFWLTSSNVNSAVYLLMWLIITSMNSIMMVKLFFNNRSLATQNSDARRRRDRQVTLLLLRICLTFSVLAIPDITIIVISNTRRSVRNFLLHYDNILSKLKMTTETLSAGCNFLFFAASGHSFRTQLISGLRQCVKKSGNQNWLIPAFS